MFDFTAPAAATARLLAADPSKALAGPLAGSALGAFLFGGDAIFTLFNPATGVRYTYRVQQKAYTRVGRDGKDVKGSCYWILLLTGPQNTTDYTYLGSLRDESVRTFALSPKARIERADLPSVAAVSWLLGRLAKFENGQAATVLVGGMEFHHAGRCGRCARTLTVPSSIENGFGEECASQRLQGRVKSVKVRQLG
jgi:hypothetical protein